MGFDSQPLRAYVEHNFTYVAGLERNLHRFGDSPAMIDPVADRSWTYRELAADVERFLHHEPVAAGRFGLRLNF